MSLSSSRPVQHPAHSTSATTTSPFQDIASLTFEELDQAQVLKQINHPSAGASVLFTGTTRDNFKGKKVSRLEYEAYTSLAIKTLHQILLRARSSTWPPPSSSAAVSQSDSQPAEPSADPQNTITKIIIHHRLGTVPISESSILVAVSSPHRRKAFQVAEWCLEQVKKEAQIWKKELYVDEKKDEGRENGEGGALGMVKGLVAETGSWKSNAQQP